MTRNQMTMARMRSYERKEEPALSSPRAEAAILNLNKKESNSYRNGPRHHYSRSPARKFESFDDSMRFHDSFMSSTRGGNGHGYEPPLNLNSIVETSHKIHNEFFPASASNLDRNDMSTDFERDRAVTALLQEPPHLSSAQDGINAIREE